MREKLNEIILWVLVIAVLIGAAVLGLWEVFVWVGLSLGLVAVCFGLFAIGRLLRGRLHSTRKQINHLLIVSLGAVGAGALLVTGLAILFGPESWIMYIGIPLIVVSIVCFFLFVLFLGAYKKPSLEER